MAIVTLDQQRAEGCFVKVQEILKVYDCRILPKVVITGQIISEYGFVVVANPKMNMASDLGVDGDNRQN